MSDSKATYSREIYVSNLRGVETFPTTLKVVEELGKKNVPKSAWDYVAGSASTEQTYDSNRRALDNWQLVPRMLTAAATDDFDMTLRLPALGPATDDKATEAGEGQGAALGKLFPTPLVLCPIGVLRQLHEEKDLAVARAASELNIPYTMSSAASAPCEEIAEAGEWDPKETPGKEAWFQLYWPSDDELTASILSRAKKCGFTTLVITLDTWALGWRPRDLDNKGYNPFLHGEGVANIFSDPVFVQKYCEGKSPLSKDATQEDIGQAAIQAIGLITPGFSRGWEDLKIARKLWGDGPIVLKGIQTPSDALRAVQHGMDGIWVSNHGGRQVDGAIGSLQALRSIVQVAHASASTSGKADGRKRPAVIFDSGIRTGADIMKALALGADLVGIGRPYAYGLAAHGQVGVDAVLRSLLADLELNAALAGCKSVEEIRQRGTGATGLEPVVVRTGSELKL
ncbi:unnamed protein product [Tilletia laevis]|uniref:FMN hydroxy acid dehydrogenase domain-containing protein n=2 Tax=Tilletia TaxID=13289 RepID=A0A8X7MWY2_9BASI|nr:hypothetical protein CF336_g2210 [Tilletia laevis]KAE8202753.1 hypothetical protein CF328_g2028 [Tilletia controversa]KAE8263993.1 hypothetical protein A4X03_0g1263 [Tilletia caries]KAE8207030.1 hypothetical protein CF335_g1439 [Tilletia laevis]KAE8252928.1 hypothetical protein A4X06_0g1835 [Tilletia controversa]